MVGSNSSWPHQEWRRRQPKTLGIVGSSLSAGTLMHTLGQEMHRDHQHSVLGVLLLRNPGGPVVPFPQSGVVTKSKGFVFLI